ncbi:hypothetical protein ACN4EG_02865 [Alkalinema pantanalense CENA528]|uniref:hypothetical protein n=1 Tax=Alkalinema pantanalense TaxID=1620705 RepID=UPI003D6F8C70
MGQHQKHLRRAAAQAFMNSLNQLEQTLCSEEPGPQVLSQPICPPVDTAITPEELDDAVADIEQFMQYQDDWPHSESSISSIPRPEAS